MRMIVALVAPAVTANVQDTYEKFAVFVVGSGSAAPVKQTLIKLLNESKPFVAVTSEKDKNRVALSRLDRKGG